MTRYCALCGHDERSHRAALRDDNRRGICLDCDGEMVKHKFEPEPALVESGRERMTL